MNNVRTSQVRDYLGRLDHALRDLPRDRRTEIVKDIQAHIDDALSDHPDPSATTIDEVLATVGTPEEIAAAAYAEMPPVREQLATRDAIAVGLLLGGGFLFGVGWLVGLVLLLGSTAWSTRDKLIGTLLVPGGLAGGLLIAGFAALVPVRTSDAGSSSSPAVFGILLLLFALAGPFFTTFWLIKHARRTP